MLGYVLIGVGTVLVAPFWAGLANSAERTIDAGRIGRLEVRNVGAELDRDRRVTAPANERVVAAERECPRVNSLNTTAHNACLLLGRPRPESPKQEDKLLPSQVGFPHDVVGYLPVAIPAALPVVNTAVPNPSFKPSTNGVPRGPGRQYAVHFRHPGPRVPPLVPS